MRRCSTTVYVAWPARINNCLVTTELASSDIQQLDIRLFLHRMKNDILVIFGNLACMSELLASDDCLRLSWLAPIS